MGIAGQPVAANLHPEIVQLLLVQASFKEGPSVNPWCGVALDVDGIAG